MGVQGLHSSAYNAQSMGLVDITLKEISMTNTNLSQLQLSELVYAVNCKEDGKTG